MQFSTLTALSPLDGRYESKVSALRPIMSEYGLIYFRTLVEVQWLVALTDEPSIPEIKPLTSAERDFLQSIVDHFTEEDALQIKTIERTTQHDVKAVEYFLRSKLNTHPTLKSLTSMIHFAATSEDINNLAYALMLKSAREQALLPVMDVLIQNLTKMAHQYANLAMLARTHGQPASPTTLGKELINISTRLQKQRQAFAQVSILGKFNGAVGNYNAHHVAYPNVDWPSVCARFVKSLGIDWNSHTTQIEPHDFIAEYLHALSRFNTIMIDLDRDIWSYIAIQYFVQQKVENEVGSSTMPHKINPIDFENSEGNLGLANALITHLANKLPISRWQRDLTDSTVLRNLGIVCGYILVAYQATLKGLNKLTANSSRIQQDLDAHWEVLAEAVQTVMRKHGIEDAYEQLKAFTRGQTIDASLIANFIQQLNLPEEVKQDLHQLTPKTYTGLAKSLTITAHIK